MKTCPRCRVSFEEQEFRPKNGSSIYGYCRACIKEYGKARLAKIRGEEIPLKCALCKRPFTKKTCWDHCHSCGQHRGYLCYACNTALGKFRDDVSLLAAAIEYLEAHKCLNNVPVVEIKQESTVQSAEHVIATPDPQQQS